MVMLVIMQAQKQPWQKPPFHSSAMLKSDLKKEIALLPSAYLLLKRVSLKRSSSKRHSVAVPNFATGWMRAATSANPVGVALGAMFIIDFTGG